MCQCGEEEKGEACGKSCHCKAKPRTEKVQAETHQTTPRQPYSGASALATMPGSQCQCPRCKKD